MQSSYVWELHLLYFVHSTFATFISYVPPNFMHDLYKLLYVCMLCGCSINSHSSCICYIYTVVTDYASGYLHQCLQQGPP